jgi:iron(III) transport system substrate-binding protein
MLQYVKSNRVRLLACQLAAVAILQFGGGALMPARAQDSASAPDPRSGTATIYISLATSAVNKMLAALKPHFPNLDIKFVRAGSIETIKRFTAERQAGRVGTDLIHGADPGGFDYFGEKQWMDPRLVTETDLSQYPEGSYDKAAGWVAMRATGIALMYNTKLLKKEDLPKTWKELADPKWKGKVAISDPNRAGSSFSHLYAMWKMYGEDYLKAFGANDVLIAGDGSATRDAIASGEREVAPVSEYDVYSLIEAGKPVDVAWLDDGTIMLPAPLALAKGSPNAENGLALGKFLLTKEGQQIIAEAVHTWSARKDVKAPSGKPELSSIKTVTFDWTKAGQEKSQLLDLYFKYFQGQ